MPGGGAALNPRRQSGRCRVPVNAGGRPAEPAAARCDRRHETQADRPGSTDARNAGSPRRCSRQSGPDWQPAPGTRRAGPCAWSPRDARHGWVCAPARAAPRNCPASWAAGRAWLRARRCAGSIPRSATTAPSAPAQRDQLVLTEFREFFLIHPQVESREYTPVNQNLHTYRPRPTICALLSEPRRPKLCRRGEQLPSDFGAKWIAEARNGLSTRLDRHTFPAPVATMHSWRKIGDRYGKRASR